jgi:carbon monoxide dehydrogenase subunit G
VAVLEFQGEELFACSPEKLFAALTDTEVLAATIPDLESSEKTGPHGMKCVVRPGFSFLRGTMKMDVAIKDLVPPKSAAMQVQAKGIGATLDIVSTMEIEPVDGGKAKLLWKARVEKLSGLVATVSRPLIQGAAGQVAKATWEKVRKRVEA